MPPTPSHIFNDKHKSKKDEKSKARLCDNGSMSATNQASKPGKFLGSD